MGAFLIQGRTSIWLKLNLTERMQEVNKELITPRLCSGQGKEEGFLRRGWVAW